MAINMLLNNFTAVSVSNENDGIYTIESPMSFELTVGETYYVLWNDVMYRCTAMDGGTVAPGAIALGNASGFGLSGNNEPFLLMGPIESTLGIVCLTDTEPTEHTVTIAQIDTETVLDESGDGVTEASFSVPENCVYFKITVTDKTGKHACTNAYFLEDILKEN